MISSVDEINCGTLAEGYDQLMDSGDVVAINEQKIREQMAEDQKNADAFDKRSYGYYLDNCGDGEWYCQHCLQPECGKRMAPRR